MYNHYYLTVNIVYSCTHLTGNSQYDIGDNRHYIDNGDHYQISRHTEPKTLVLFIDFVIRFLLFKYIFAYLLL